MNQGCFGCCFATAQGCNLRLAQFPMRARAAALNGSREATAALPIARTLAALHGGRLSLVRVVHRSSCGTVRLACQSRNAMRCLPSGRRAAQARGSRIARLDAGTIGGRRRSHPRECASELLAKSRAPVVLVRAGAHPVTELRQILVPIDRSQTSEQSLAAAAELARLAGAKLTLLSVVTPSPVPVWAVETVAPLEFGEYVDSDQLDQAALADARQYVNRPCRATPGPEHFSRGQGHPWGRVGDDHQDS